jgi:ribose transport system substrate-binding protein
MRTITSGLLLAALLLSSGVPVSAGPNSPGTIGVSLLTRKHEFYTFLENGLRKAARAKGYSLIVKAGEYDTDTQLVQVRHFIAKKVQAIVLTPCDSRRIGNAIAEANAASIPVFTVDIANLSNRGSVVAHIASDNIDGGRKAAALMIRALRDSGTVVIINHPNVTSVMDRVAGFRAVMSGHPRIRIIAEIPAWGLRDRAMSIMEDILVKIADVDGVFAINDNSALGALDAIDAAGKKTELIGYDAIPEVRKAINQGKIFGAVIQYPEEIGASTIETIAAYFDGKKVPPEVIVPVGVLTRDGK